MLLQNCSCKVSHVYTCIITARLSIGFLLAYSQYLSIIFYSSVNLYVGLIFHLLSKNLNWFNTLLLIFKTRRSTIDYWLVSKHIYLSSKYSSIPYFEPSRPKPDCLMPPKGANSVEIEPLLTPTMPYSKASLTRHCRAVS